MKTQYQKRVENTMQFYENQKIKAAIKSGILPKSESSIKIEHPVVGFKENTVKIFEWYEDTSWLLIEGISGWSFYDAKARLLLFEIVPQLTNLQKKIHQHNLGKYLIFVPKNKWVWFYLKRPVAS